ncbi:MAG: DUF2802 domain-containing protein [Pseudomonadota bacterium]
MYILSTETLLVAQIVIEILLIILVGLLLVKYRRVNMNPVTNNIEKALNLAAESEKICQVLAANLNEKRELADRILSEIDNRLEDSRNLSAVSGHPSNQTGIHLTPRNGEVPYSHVIEMRRSGLSVEEIAERLSMSKGEIELVLGLAANR